jgi:heat shock protein HspQ
MQVGDLVRHDLGYIGIITCINPKNSYFDEVEVHWNDGEVCNLSMSHLEVICK